MLVALPRRLLLHGDRRAARLRLQDGGQRAPAREAQGRRPPALARRPAVITAHADLAGHRPGRLRALVLVLAVGGAIARRGSSSAPRGASTSTSRRSTATSRRPTRRTAAGTREALDAAAQAAWLAERGADAPAASLTLVQIVDRPGTDDDKAVYEITATAARAPDARPRAATSGSSSADRVAAEPRIPPDLRARSASRAILERDGGECVWCGRPLAPGRPRPHVRARRAPAQGRAGVGGERGAGLPRVQPAARPHGAVRLPRGLRGARAGAQPGGDPSEPAAARRRDRRARRAAAGAAVPGARAAPAGSDGDGPVRRSASSSPRSTSAR